MEPNATEPPPPPPLGRRGTLELLRGRFRGRVEGGQPIPSPPLPPPSFCGACRILCLFFKDFAFGVLTDWYFFWPWLGLPLLLGEALLCVAMVQRVPYTKIDWDAYMSEVEGPLVHGDWDYMHLRGDTGPLVYPAGFVWLYGGLRWLTGGGVDAATGAALSPDGADIRAAQYVFAAMYVATQACVFLLYQRASAGASSRIPPWVCALLCVSKRMHSLYALRLFNDCWAMFLLYGALLVFTHKAWRQWRWPVGCLLFSAAVSIKMNVLLFAPALWMLLIKDVGFVGSLNCIALCAFLQVGLAAPFLATNFWGYVGRSFELGRVFMHKWTVNLKFLPEEIFVSKWLALGLLACHLGVLGMFLAYRWCHSEGGVGGVVGKALAAPYVPTSVVMVEEAEQAEEEEETEETEGQGKASKKKKKITAAAATTVASVKRVKRALSTEHILVTMLTCNFIGIVFCRSMHFQFYCWYWHSVPFLLWQNERLPTLVKIALIMALEYTWSYHLEPVEGTATPESSAVLQVAHLCMLASLWFARPVDPWESPGEEQLGVARAWLLVSSAEPRRRTTTRR